MTNTNIENLSLVPTLLEIQRILDWSCELIPDNSVRISLVPNISSTRLKCAGWFGDKTWSTREGVIKAEIGIPPETLGRDPYQIAGTIVHETAHAWNSAMGISDCATNQRHNKKFKLAAETLGLCVSDPKDHRGYGYTELTDQLRSRIEKELSPDVASFDLYKLSNKQKPDREKIAKRLVWICDCGVQISCARGVTLLATCDRCRQPFKRRDLG